MATERKLLPMLGKSAAIEDIRDFVVGVSLLKEPVLLTGDAGTGKALASHKIHAVGRTARTPFMRVSCGRFEEEELEQLLFCDSDGPVSGLLGSDSGATCYLAGIEHLPPRLVGRVHEFLHDTSANEGAPRLILSSRFSFEDLYHGGLIEREFLEEISHLHMRIPPLRERIEDVPVICNYQVWLNTPPEEYDDRWDAFSATALPDLLTYPWPGNVAELIDVVRSYCGSQGDTPARYDTSCGGSTPGAIYLREFFEELHCELLALLHLEDLSGRQDLLLPEICHQKRYGDYGE